MARIRTIKPEYWSSEQIVECSRDARLLFIGLWNFANDFGVHKNSPKTIRSRVFPGDDDITADVVRRLIDELVRNDLVGIFVGPDGAEYIHILTWDVHQRVDRPNTKNAVLPPKKASDYLPRSPKQRRMKSDLFDEHSLPEGKGKEGKGREEEGKLAASAREDFDSSNAPDEPEPADPPRAAKPPAAVDVPALGAEVLGIVGYPLDSVMHFAPIGAWVAAGYTPDEIRTAAHAIAQRIPPGMRNPLAWMSKAMPDEVAVIRRAAAGQTSSPAASAHPPADCTGWRLRFWKAHGSAAYESWIKPAAEVRDGARVVLAFPTAFVRDWVQNNFGDKLRQLIHNDDSTVQRVDFVIGGVDLPRKTRT